MFLEMITSTVRRELEKNGFSLNGELSLISFDNDVYTLLFECEDNEYTIKYYEKEAQKLVNNYNVIEKCKIPSIDYVLKSDSLIIYKNLKELDSFCCVRIYEIDDIKVVKGLARWYKNLHSYDDNECRNYYKGVTISNVMKVMKEFKLSDVKAMAYIYNNFSNIELKFKRINRCLVYGNCDRENVLLCKENGDVLRYDYDGLCKGNRYSDIKNVLSLLDSKYHADFMCEYGQISEIEKIIDDVVGVIAILIKALGEKKFPLWAKEALEIVSREEFYNKVKSLVEWY